MSELGTCPHGHRVTTECSQRSEGSGPYVFVYSKHGGRFREVFPPSESAEVVAREIISGKRKCPYAPNE